ncbi:MAG TPA: hypothetical protein VK907_13465 [Phnomibacter sp.]|nr:hypothetical protein [Phnomibacter sp.]
MYFTRISFLCILVLTLASCQKEYSFESDGDGPQPNSGLLIKTFIEDIGATMESRFDYNSADLMTGTKIDLLAGNFSASVITDVVRDANGRINSAKMKYKTSLSADSITFTYTFSRNAAGRINYYIVSGEPSFAGYDSILCTYSTANKLIGALSFYVDHGTGLAEPSQLFEYTFNGNNLVAMKSYDLENSPTTPRLVETVTLEYDNRPAPMVLTEDEFILGMGHGVPSANNVTRNITINEDDPDENVTTEYQYTYGTNGKPLTAVILTTRPGIPTGQGKITFFYQ